MIGRVLGWVAGLAYIAALAFVIGFAAKILWLFFSWGWSVL